LVCTSGRGGCRPQAGTGIERTTDHLRYVTEGNAQVIRRFLDPGARAARGRLGSTSPDPLHSSYKLVTVS